MNKISIIGSGTMGTGIAQIAGTFDHEVCVYDNNVSALNNAKNKLNKILDRLITKERISNDKKDKILSKINFTNNFNEIENSKLVIEAIIEDLEVKKKIFKNLEDIVSEKCILATNTSSLSIASVASACNFPHRVVGIHFFNPAPLMPLVEIIPAVQTNKNILNTSRSIIDSWGKITVLAKDTPGFIVNRVARPFYGESIRIFEEGIANYETIDWALKNIGGFKMGPFELMDYIGNDINYKVTETVFSAFYYDSRYKPSLTQKRIVEAGYFGRKSGRGFYNYEDEEDKKEINKNNSLAKEILWRVLSMLINEAIDAVYLNIASIEDIDLAMKKGVNYPKGLLKWADELGLENVLHQLENLHSKYKEERYRPSPLLRNMVKKQKKFY